MNAQVIRPRSIGITSIRAGHFFTVASVELGNTTTKCILMTTNLDTAEIFEIWKEVRMTRDVRPPAAGEEVFGQTITGTALTRASVSEFISDTLISAVKKARLDLDRDVHFVVRSTGVTAGFSQPSEVGEMVKALADGCLQAGVPPRKMTASLSEEGLPAELRPFTWLRKVYFDGAVASSVPPSATEIVANEMEGELVTAGMKGAAKSTTIDFRNPAITLDFGTTLAGRVTDDGYPYAKTIGSFAGLAGAIPDALVRGSGLVDSATGCVLDFHMPDTKPEPGPDPSWAEEVQALISVERVAEGKSRFGTVPVNPHAADQAGVVILGVDAGVNGSKLSELEKVGKSFVASEGPAGMGSLIDAVQAMTVERLVGLADSEGLILPESSLGFTGRAVVTGRKPEFIAQRLRDRMGRAWAESHHLMFVEDGLAMGAAVAARCMNSMGTRHNPMGGRKGDKCIMPARMKLQSHGKRSPGRARTGSS